jgi:hypothetical protein
MFPELENKPDTKNLIGLRITLVMCNLHDEIQFIRAEDEVGEVHEISFSKIEQIPDFRGTVSRIKVELDAEEVAYIKTEVK